MYKGYPCPCCGYLTLGEEPPGTFYICPVCFWEDDNVQYDDPDYKGGANEMSLNEAKASFRAIGAISPKKLKDVRPPKEDEIPKD
jgi:nitrogen fixation-related uncharacterized protein